MDCPLAGGIALDHDRSASISDFLRERSGLKGLMEGMADREMKRFLSLDGQVYTEGALPSATKELMGLVASTVLRCDDCIRYHLVQCRKLSITDAQLIEALDIALMVGGSITIPHVRRALASWREMKDDTSFLEGI
jgi:AhpD family alkylhydroperoxidase